MTGWIELKQDTCQEKKSSMLPTGYESIPSTLLEMMRREYTPRY